MANSAEADPSGHPRITGRLQRPIRGVGTGLENRAEAKPGSSENTDGADRCADGAGDEIRRLVAVLDMEPELREAADAWNDLDEPVRLAILHLIRAKSAKH